VQRPSHRVTGATELLANPTAGPALAVKLDGFAPLCLRDQSWPAHTSLDEEIGNRRPVLPKLDCQLKSALTGHVSTYQLLVLSGG
jgi:hypothetical protein